MAFGRDVRGAIFRKVESFSRAELDRFGTASLITRNTNDVQQVQMVVLMGLNMMIIAPILAVGGIIMALRQDVPLSGILIVVLPLMALIVGILMSRALPLFQAMQVKIDRVNQVTREALSGIRVIRAFVRTDHEEERFDVANQDLTATSLRVNRLFALMLPSLMLIFNLSTVAILWFGSIRVDSGEMPIGNLIAFLQYVMQILFAVMMAVFMFVMVPRAVVSSGRIQEVLRTTPIDRGPARTRSPPRPATGALDLPRRRVPLPGAEDPVLRDISLSIEPGQTTAIVGSTGSGKTTLINLIPRFYDVTGGELDIDGVDVRAVLRDDLWARIGLIPQKAFLFSGTIASNLRFGRPTPPTTSCGTRCGSPRPRPSSASSRVRSRRPSPRAARTCRVASASGWPSPGRSSSARRSTSSTTASRPSTSGPTRSCGRRSRARSRTRPSSSSPSGSGRS